jgi:hypothetical protein
MNAVDQTIKLKDGKLLVQKRRLSVKLQGSPGANSMFTAGIPTGVSGLVSAAVDGSAVPVEARVTAGHQWSARSLRGLRRLGESLIECIQFLLLHTLRVVSSIAVLRHATLQQCLNVAVSLSLWK